MNPRNISILAFAAVVAGAGGLMYRHSILADNPAGIAVQVAAFALMVWARITFGRRSFHAAANPTEGGLVTWGPYRYFRHPIYAAIIYFLWTAVVSHPNAINAAFALLSTVGTAIRIAAEESFLRQQFPEYAEYSARTKRIVPLLF